MEERGLGQVLWPDGPLKTPDTLGPPKDMGGLGFRGLGCRVKGLRVRIHGAGLSWRTWQRIWEEQGNDAGTSRLKLKVYRLGF